MRARLDHVLAVVEDDENTLRSQPFRQSLNNGAPALFANIECRSDRVRYEAGVGERRKLDEPDTVLESVGGSGRDLDREARLADAARSGQRYEPLAREQVPDL